MANDRKARRPRSTATASATLHAGVAVSLLVGELACVRGGSPPPPEAQQATVQLPPATAPMASASASAPASAEPEDPSVGAALRAYVVAPPKLARRTLYTWTTPEQIVELLRDRILLTRSESPEHGASYFARILADRAAQKDALAARLRTDAFVRARYAWPAPFATFGGWVGERYGGKLLRIDLKPTAWIAVLRTSRPGWEVIDLDDRPIELAEALRHPDRIAAVHFLHDSPSAGDWRTHDGPLERAGFREYVICNESMVESWSLDTEAIARELDAEADAIAAFARHLRRRPAPPEELQAWNTRIAREVWPSPALPTTAEATYESTLAFPNEGYLPRADELSTLAEELRKVVPGGGKGIEHRPKVVFNPTLVLKKKEIPAPAGPPARKERYHTF